MKMNIDRHELLLTIHAFICFSIGTITMLKLMNILFKTI